MGTYFFYFFMNTNIASNHKLDIKVTVTHKPAYVCFNLLQQNKKLGNLHLKKVMIFSKQLSTSVCLDQKDINSLMITLNSKLGYIEYFKTCHFFDSMLYPNC